MTEHPSQEPASSFFGRTVTAIITGPVTGDFPDHDPENYIEPVVLIDLGGDWEISIPTRRACVVHPDDKETLAVLAAIADGGFAGHMRERFAEALTERFPASGDYADPHLVVTFTDHVGDLATRYPRVSEVAEACAAVRDQDLETAQAATARVRELHAPVPVRGGGKACRHCCCGEDGALSEACGPGQCYPCPTIRALDGEATDERP